MPPQRKTGSFLQIGASLRNLMHTMDLNQIAVRFPYRPYTPLVMANRCMLHLDRKVDQCRWHSEFLRIQLSMGREKMPVSRDKTQFISNLLSAYR
jgi:hypothetical protein